MSTRQQTLDLIARYYDAFNKGDHQTMLSCVAETIAHDVNQGARRIGKAAFTEFNAHMDQCYQEQLENIIIMASDDGKNAAAEFIVNGVYKSTDEGLPAANGQTYRLPAGAFLEVSEGKITRITTYYNLQDWINQVSKTA